jgi:hypothetical protein
MDRPRILLAVQPRLLSSALYEVLSRHPNFIVFDAGAEHVNILAGARRHPIDVVVATFEPSGDVPQPITQLLAEFPGIRVVAVDLQNGILRTYRSDAPVATVEDCTVSGIIREILSGTGACDETAGDPGA